MSAEVHCDHNDVVQTTFRIEWGGEADLTVREIWPDGDAPESPTRDDVIAQMQKERSLSRLLDNWNLDVEGIEVEGKNVVFPR